MKVPAILLFVAAVLLFSLAATDVFGQSAPPAFEVAVVKPNLSGSGNSGNRTAGDRYTGTNLTLVQLLRNAYAVQEFQLAGYPDWATNDRFDVDAKLSAGAKTTDWPLALQALLAERFKLAVHREQRPGPVYNLVVAKDGPKLATGDPSKCSTGSCFNATPTEILATSVTMPAFAARLSRSIGTHVVDATSLKGVFDFTLTWLADDQFTGRGASANPTIFTAIQEQLGLRLQSGRGPVETLVIDRAEKPVTD